MEMVPDQKDSVSCGFSGLHRKRSKIVAYTLGVGFQFRKLDMITCKILTEYGRYCFYLLDVVFMAYLSEYKQHSHDGFPYPFFCLFKA